MGGQDQPDPLIVDGVKLMRAFFKIADAADRRKVIALRDFARFAARR